MKTVTKKTKSKTFTLTFGEQEYNDLMSLVGAGLLSARERHKDSPKFLKAASKLHDRLWHELRSQLGE